MNLIIRKPIFLVVILIPILIFVAPNVHADKHLSNAQRYSDGYTNGGQQATTDFQNHQPFNLSCDPTSIHTSGGGHTKIYCRGWTDGYTATRHNLALANPPPANTLTTTPNTTTASNPPIVNTTASKSPTTASPLQQQVQAATIPSWAGPLFLFIFIIILIAVAVWRLRHRRGKYRERQYFSDSVKENILEKQHHRCAKCKRLLNVVDYDHKDDDRSNNKESNCVALCPNCHAVKTRSTK